MLYLNIDDRIYIDAGMLQILVTSYVENLTIICHRRAIPNKKVYQNLQNMFFVK